MRIETTQEQDDQYESGENRLYVPPRIEVGQRLAEVTGANGASNQTAPNGT